MSRKLFALVLTAILAITILAACAGSPAETTTAPETSASETTAAATTTTSAPEETTVAETSDTEPDPQPVGSPELIWSFEYDDAEFAPGSLAVHPDGELVTVGAYMATYTHRLYDGELAAVDTDYRHSVDDLIYSPDGRYLAAGLALYGVLIKDLTGELEPLQLHGGYNNFVAFAPDSAVLATGNRSGEIWLWSIPEGEQLAEFFDGERAFLWGLAYHPSGGKVASLQWNDDGVINVWSIENGQLVQTLMPQILVGGTNNVIRYSPDGQYFAAYFQENWEHSLRIFDTENYELAVEIPLENSAVQIAFSPDSQMIAVASIYEAATVWSAVTGELIYTLDQDIDDRIGGSRAISFTPDGGHLAVIRNFGDMELWRLPGAVPLPEPAIDIYQPIPIPGDVLFDTGSSELKAEADTVLRELAEEIFSSLPTAKLTFIGHTDSRGDASANMRLSLDRAESVKNWFESWAEETGAAEWTFAVDGKGETQLKTPDVDGDGNFREEAGRVNRRVEIEIEPAG